MTFAGLVRWAAGAPTAADIEEVRRTGAPPAALVQKVRQLPQHLPEGVRLVTSHQLGAGDIISVLVVEAGSIEGLRAITGYYAGWFDITWHPTNVVERD